MRFPPRNEVLNKSKTVKKKNPKTGRMAQFYKCAKCKKEFTSKDVQVDHINPIGFDKTWDEFIDKLFCEKENLQVLCVPCHKKKSKEEQKKQ